MIAEAWAEKPTTGAACVARGYKAMGVLAASLSAEPEKKQDAAAVEAAVEATAAAAAAATVVEAATGATAAAAAAAAAADLGKRFAVSFRVKATRKVCFHLSFPLPHLAATLLALE